MRELVSVQLKSIAVSADSYSKSTIKNLSSIKRFWLYVIVTRPNSVMLEIVTMIGFATSGYLN